MIKRYFSGIILMFLTSGVRVNAQTELMPWGNITGVRIEGQLMQFESSLHIVKNDWKEIQSTSKEKQRPKYERRDLQQIVTTLLDQVAITESVEEIGKDGATIRIKAEAREDVLMDGLFMSFSLPTDYYKTGTVQVNKEEPVVLSSSLERLTAVSRGPINSIRFSSALRQLELSFSEPVSVIFKKETDTKSSQFVIYIPIYVGNLSKGAIAEKAFSLKASGTVDKSAVSLQLNTTKTGRVFDGLGGNFRLQNLQTDPQVIDYCLENLRVAWGRVEMPWRFWQAQKDSNPIDSAKSSKLHANVKRAMEMAQRLYKKGMPVILSAWSGPDWAIEGAPKSRPGADGVWGNPLNKENKKAIYKSIADYVVYLKDQYGVEISMFSFNESDLGINVRQTGEEHAELIRELGAYFAERGLKTKLLLGDNSDATTYEFIYPAMNDTAAHPYIGAVSFHSWRGWEKETLQKWADAATKINRPLLVGEGSIDAQAWGYPAAFEETFYALEEINLYIKMLNICQPASILQWQLTADYSPLAGGGIFGNNEPLRPTQRFWNLKQLASTPGGLISIPATSNKGEVTIAALGNQSKKLYSIHLVNNGASRLANLTGLPAGITSLRVVITDKQRAMKEGELIPVKNGRVSFLLESGTYTTLTNK